MSSYIAFIAMPVPKQRPVPAQQYDVPSASNLLKSRQHINQPGPNQNQIHVVSSLQELCVGARGRLATRVLVKGGDPAAGSPTATLLRLHPSHRPLLGDLPPLRVGSATSGATDSHGVTGGVYKARERIHRSMLTCDY